MKAVVLAARSLRKPKQSRRRDRFRRHGYLRRSARRAVKRHATGAHATDRSDYELGYRQGLSDGAEQLLELHSPSDMIIPDISASEAMVAGVQALRARAIPLLDAPRVYEELDGAVRERRPYSFIRLGDGELVTLAQEVVIPVSAVRASSPFLPYAGIVVPNLQARDEIARSIRSASLVGVPISRKPQFQPLLFQTLRAHGIPCAGLKLTTSTMNYALQEQGYLWPLLSGRRLLVVGNVAGELAQALRLQGMIITGVVSPVRGYSDVDRAVDEAIAYDFDIALVSAGIPAVPIVVRIVQSTGKVAIDFGHSADRIAGVRTKVIPNG
ncbi:GT-D fold domain-containing glycosyltransferase [Cohnella panacarvi]|uniref:GT-D fold domain-containing protein n=1 Tax=Cohnella panacarvi TaxID=400776 RepID=UPI00047CDDC2|nr:GT-D fold domain-containing glycosyltransferase [Cohnella panacarvi]